MPICRLVQVAGLLARHWTQAGDLQRAARYAEMAAEHALTLEATTEAIAFYQQSLTLEPHPARRLGLGRALHRQGDLLGASTAFEAARVEFESRGDREGAAQACLGMAEAYIWANRFEEVVHWAAMSLTYLDNGGRAASALAHFLLGAGQMHTDWTLTEAEQHLTTASRLAAENHLLQLESRICFELGNVLAIRDELVRAYETFLKTITLAQAAGDPLWEVLGHNNAAYDAIQLSDLTTAQKHIEAGLALVETHKLVLPRQWLYSTYGELALAQANWDEAESWFSRGLRETERHSNHIQAANYQANLGLVARGRGDLDSAVLLLEEARKQVAQLSAPYLHAQINLWLADIYMERGEHASVLQVIHRAEKQLERSDYQYLRAWMQRIRKELGTMPLQPS